MDPDLGIKTPDDGRKSVQNKYKFFTKIKLGNSASCWLVL